MAELRSRVFATNACDSIPGCNIKIENFLPRMWSAVAKGFIPHADGVQLQEGLLRGFKLGVDVDQMTGHRWFSNYESATTVGRAGVAAAVASGQDARAGPDGTRPGAGHTLRLHVFMHLPDGGRREGASSWSDPGPAGVARWRPPSDHTRTGLNAATDMTGLRFT